jgi:GT2 family glycosyltransferase
MSSQPSVSIIINTDGRAAILGNTIESLRYLRYPRLELVVVPGPTADGTRELLDRHWRGEIKIGFCPTRNIAQSRNIGIALAAGEVIAFLDDDEIPEPEWLEDLVPLLEDPAVAVAGGWLVDHTGKGYQARFETVDRFGNVRSNWERAAPEFNFPLSFNVPHAMINSTFRRSALIDVGGFDEEYEYLLDETDLMIRFVDRGWHVVQTDRGLVHHKYLPSAVRNEQRVLTSWYSLIKNKAYFALLHGRRFAAIDRILADISRSVENSRSEMRDWIDDGLIPPEAGARFEREAEEALRDGLARALRGRRRLGDPRRLAGDPAGFLPFHTRLPPARQRCLVFLSGASPAAGDGREVSDLARAAAAQGHQVHLLTRGGSHDRVDFEEGMWVHRLVLRPYAAPADTALPAEVWQHSLTLLAEAEEIAKRRPIAAVHAPLASAAAIAFLRARKWPLVTSLPAAPRRERDDDGRRRPLRRLLTESDGLLAPDRAALAAIEADYGIALDRDRLAILSDTTAVQEVEFLMQIANNGQPAASYA